MTGPRDGIFLSCFSVFPSSESRRTAGLVLWPGSPVDDGDHVTGSHDVEYSFGDRFRLNFHHFFLDGLPNAIATIRSISNCRQLIVATRDTGVWPPNRARTS